jgi:hypothetical protein
VIASCEIEIARSRQSGLRTCGRSLPGVLLPKKSRRLSSFVILVIFLGEYEVERAGVCGPPLFGGPLPPTAPKTTVVPTNHSTAAVTKKVGRSPAAALHASPNALAPSSFTSSQDSGWSCAARYSARGTARRRGNLRPPALGTCSCARMASASIGDRFIHPRPQPTQTLTARRTKATQAQPQAPQKCKLNSSCIL